MKRRKISGKKLNRKFRHAFNSTKRVNVAPPVMRGGICL